MEGLQNPVALAAKPRPAKGRDRRHEDGEEERLLAVASPQFKPVNLVALETAMRRKEIADLRWKCVNLGNRNVFLPETKNSEARTKAKLDDLRFYDLCHEATSRFFELTDLDVMEIKAVTGHKMLKCWRGTRTCGRLDWLTGWLG